jgi:hypothetical protein
MGADRTKTALARRCIAVNSMAISRQIDVLVAELAAIELWDDMYQSAFKRDLVDQTAFETRQARRQQIQHDIQVLRERIQDETCASE